jgi:hypothetical protein
VPLEAVLAEQNPSGGETVKREVPELKHVVITRLNDAKTKRPTVDFIMLPADALSDANASPFLLGQKTKSTRVILFE